MTPQNAIAPDELQPAESPAAVPPAEPEPPGFVHRIEGDAGLLPAMQSVVSLIVIALFIMTFLVQPFRIPSASMEPTLLVGDFLLVAKHAPIGAAMFSLPAVSRGEVIVFHDPVDPDIHLVKRVIGLPGDHLRLRDQRVYINGRPLDEPYAVYLPGRPDSFRDDFPRLQSTDPAVDSAWWVRLRLLTDHGELLIPEGNYFVLGDNRNDSQDSRYWGFVPAAAIVGHPLVIYFSLRNLVGDDSISHPQTTPPSQPRHTFLGFARWDRTMRVVR